MILTLIKAIDASSIADCLSQSVALNKQTQVRRQFDTCVTEKLSSKKVDSDYWSGILTQCLWSCIIYVPRIKSSLKVKEDPS